MHLFRDCLWFEYNRYNRRFSLAARFQVEIARYECWRKAVAMSSERVRGVYGDIERYRFHVIGNTLLRLGLEMHLYSHDNADYRVAPFAVSTNGKVRGTHRRMTVSWDSRASLHFCDRPIDWSIGRSAVSSRRSISVIDSALLHVSSPFVTPIILYLSDLSHSEWRTSSR